MVKMFKKLILFVAPVLFISCLTIDAGIELRDNSSGVLRYDASFATLAADLESINGGGSIVFFPLLKKSADEKAQAISGVRFAEPSVQSDDGSTYNVLGELLFDDLASLSEFSGVQFISEASGNNTILTVTVYSVSEGGAVSPNVLDIVRNSFSEDYIEIQTVIPGDIIRVEGAVFTGSTVTFRIGLAEMLESSENVQFTVEYR